MCKKINGYFTVEASFIVPIVLLLYFLIMVSGFYLYDRCVISQDCYLLAFRAGNFSDAEENYGEVIYADMSGNIDEDYVRSRLAYKSELYPYLGEGEITVYIQGEVITVSVSGFEELLHMSKSVHQNNALKIIRSVRRQGNGSKIP